MGELNILYVDDDTIIRSIAKMTLLREPGISVRDFSNGKAAIEDTSGVRTDLILLDFMMPDMDGLQVMKALRENEKLAETPVIFVTSNVKPEEIDIFMKSGAIGVIAKPFDLLELPRQVLQILSDYRAGKTLQ